MLRFSEAATVGALRVAMRERLHMQLDACRLVPFPAVGADVRASDDRELLVDVLGGCRNVEVLARARGGAAPASTKVFTTITGLGLLSHLGPAIPADAGIGDARRRAAEVLVKALNDTIAENVASVCRTQLVAASSLYLWGEDLVQSGLAEFNAAAITEAFGTPLSAKAFGNGIFTAAAGKSSTGGNAKLPDSLKQTVRELRQLVADSATAAASDLCGKLHAEGSSLGAALKQAAKDGNFGTSTASNEVRAAAGQSFGTAIRNHLKADTPKAQKRVLFQAVKVALAAAQMQLNEKVKQLSFVFSSFRHFVIS